MTRADRVIIAITLVVVLCLGALSAYFFLGNPFGTATNASSTSRDDDDQDESEAEADVEDEVDEPLDDLVLSIGDFGQLWEYASVDGVTLIPSDSVFTSDSFSQSIIDQWAGQPESCFGAYLVTSLLTTREVSGSPVEMGSIVHSVALTADFSDSYLTAFGRVLDTPEQASDLLADFDAAGERCDDAFEVLRDDGSLRVSSTEYGDAGFDVPSTVSARTVEFSVDGGDLTGFRADLLQRGNTVIVTVAIIKPSTTFSEFAADELAESLAIGLGNF